MKIMIKFEIDVLSEMSYADLISMFNKLTYSIEISNKLLTEYVENGAITRAASVEASIIRTKENLNSIKLVMTSKESDALESFKFGMEPISLN